MSIEAQLTELRARLQLLEGGDSPSLILAVAQSDALLDESSQILTEILRATPLKIAALGACESNVGPAKWAELTRTAPDAAAFTLSFQPRTPLAVTGFARLLNAERQWLRKLAGPLVLVVSRQTERELRLHAQDFFTWVAHSYELPAPQELAAVASRLGVTPETVAPRLPPEPPIRFLHISDLHLRPQHDKRYDQDRVLDGLLTFLERDRQQFPLDLIFVTGDLAHSGQAAQYALVSDLLKQLMARTAVPPERVFVVPGNHDVDRGVGRWLLRTLSGDDDATAFFEDPRSRAFHQRKLAAYQQSLQSVLGATRHLGLGVGASSVEVVEVRGARIAVASFNSAWFAQGDDDREKLWVGEANVMRAADAVADEDAIFAIAMQHHPFGDLNPLDRERVEPWLDRSFDLMLRGHLHANKTRSIASQRGGFVEVAAPAAYQGSKWANGCFLGEIRPHARTVRLRPYMYSAGPDPWVLDTRVFPDDEQDGYCHTFTVPAKHRLKSAIGRPLRAATAEAMKSLPAERQREITQQLARAPQGATSTASLSNVVVRSSDEWKDIAGREDPGIAWVSAIVREAEALGWSKERIVIKDVASLKEALLRAGRLFLREPPSRRPVRGSIASIAFAAAVGAVVAGQVTTEAEIGPGHGLSRKADLLIQSEGAEVILEMAVGEMTAAKFSQLESYIRLTTAKLGALVIFRGSPIGNEPGLEQVKSPAGFDVLVVTL